MQRATETKSQSLVLTGDAYEAVPEIKIDQTAFLKILQTAYSNIPEKKEKEKKHIQSDTKESGVESDVSKSKQGEVKSIELIHEYIPDQENEGFKAQLNEIRKQIRNWAIRHNKTIDQKIENLKSEKLKEGIELKDDAPEIESLKREKFDKKGLRNLRLFCQHLFEVGESQPDPDYYKDIKIDLEEFYCLLQNESIPRNRKFEHLNAMAMGMKQCGPGMPLHIQRAKNRLAAAISFPYWLADCRTTVIEEYAELHIQRYNIHKTYAAHVYRALNKFATEKGWAPLERKRSSVTDHFEKGAEITPNVLKDFENYFLAHYNLRRIVEYFTLSFQAEFYSQYKAYQQKEGKRESAQGWVPFHQDVMNISSSIFTNLGLDVVGYVFNVKRDSNITFIKFDPNLFKGLLLEYCRKNKKLTAPNAWTELPHFTKHVYHPKDPIFADLAWIRDTDGDQVCFDTVPSTDYFEYVIFSPEEKEQYRADSLSRYQSSDRFHLSSTPASVASMFPTSEALIKFTKQLVEEKTLFQNPSLFLQILRTDPNRFKAALNALEPEIIQQLLNALEVNYIILSPKNPLHSAIMGLSQGEGNLEKDLAERIQFLEQERLAFKKRAPQLHFDESKLEQKDLNEFQELCRIVQSPARYDEVFQIRFKEFMSKHFKDFIPAAGESTPDQDFRLALFEYKEIKKNPDYPNTPIHYIELVRRAMNATDDDQFIYEIYLRHFFPDFAAPIGTKPSLAFKMAHDESNSYLVMTEYFDIFNFVQNSDAKIELSVEDVFNWLHFSLSHVSLQDWAFLCDQPEALNRIYLTAPEVFRDEKNVDKATHFDQKMGTSLLSWAIICRQRDVINRLLANPKAKINIPDTYQEQPIHIAARYGDLESLEALYKRGALLNATTEQGTTPLLIAMELGHLDIVKFLIEHGVKVDPVYFFHRVPLNIINYLIKQGLDINAQVNGGNPTLAQDNALLFAVRRDDLETVEYLLSRGARIDVTDYMGRTPLILAVQKGNLDIVKYLLDHGSTLDEKTPIDEYNAAFHAVIKGQLSVLKYLVERKADLMVTDPKLGGSLLHWAAQLNHIEIFQFLLEKNVPIDTCNNKGVSPLFLAIQSRNQGMIVLLVESKANINRFAVDEETTPLSMALSTKDLTLIRYLVEQKADINAKSKSGMSPVVIASGLHHVDMVKYLIEQKANLTSAFLGQVTPLLPAISANNLPLVRMLVEAKADIHIKQPGGKTLLHHAADVNNEDIVKFLLEQKTDVNAVSEIGMTPLIIAVWKNNTSMSKFLIEAKAEVNAASQNGTNALLIAASQNNSSLALYLIENKADIHAKFSDGNTPLLFAARLNNSVLIRTLVENKADANVQLPRDGNTPLLYAAKLNNTAMVNLLIETKADVNAKLPKDGSTPLLYAAKLNNNEMMKMLVESKADVNVALSKDGSTPLLYAATHNNTEMIKYLVESKANVNAMFSIGSFSTPLLLSTLENNIEAVRFLLEKKADLQVQDMLMTPLMAAISKNNFKMIEVLIEAKMDINAQINTGTTPLDWAIVNNNLQMAQFLLEHKANVNQVGNSENSPLIFAVESSRLDFVNLLIKHRADVNCRRKNSDSALIIAAQTRNSSVIAALLYNNADLHAISDRGYSVLFEAIASNLKHITRYLVESKADINYINPKDGKSALHIALENRCSLDIIKYLLTQNGNPNYVNSKDNTTPLSLAVNKGRTDAVTCLLESRASPFQGNNNASLYHDALSPELKRIIIIAELKSFITDTKIKEGKDADRKSDRLQLFSHPLDLPTVQKLLEAINSNASKTELVNLKLEFPKLNELPLKDYFDKIHSFSPDGPAQKLGVTVSTSQPSLSGSPSDRTAR